MSDLCRPMRWFQFFCSSPFLFFRATPNPTRPNLFRASCCLEASWLRQPRPSDRSGHQFPSLRSFDGETRFTWRELLATVAIGFLVLHILVSVILLHTPANGVASQEVISSLCD